MDSVINFRLRTKVFFYRNYRILPLYAKNRSLKVRMHLFLYALNKNAGKSIQAFVGITASYKCQSDCVRWSDHAYQGNGKQEWDTSDFPSSAANLRKGSSI